MEVNGDFLQFGSVQRCFDKTDQNAFPDPGLSIFSGEPLREWEVSLKVWVQKSYQLI